MTKKPRSPQGASARQLPHHRPALWNDDFVKMLRAQTEQPLMVSCLHLEQMRQRMRIAERDNDDELYESLRAAITACRLQILLDPALTTEDWHCKAEALLLVTVAGENESLLTAAEAVLIEEGLQLGLTDAAAFLRHHKRR